MRWKTGAALTRLECLRASNQDLPYTVTPNVTRRCSLPLAFLVLQNNLRTALSRVTQRASCNFPSNAVRRNGNLSKYSGPVMTAWMRW